MLLFLATRGGASLFDLQKAAQSVSVGKRLSEVTGVLLYVGQNDSGTEITYFSGDSTGYVLRLENSFGSQETADAVLSTLKLRGWRYQPYEAQGGIVDPAVEIGDCVRVDGIDSSIASKKTAFGRLMRSTISAPNEEEVDHEYTFVPRTQREFKRESAYARSRITQNENQIQLEVARATAAEGTLSSRITQTADSISAEVTRATEAEGSLSSLISQNANAITAKVSKTGGTASSFAWSLTDSGWSLISNGSTVFSADASGISVNGSGTFSGTITATAGTIGGVTIANGVLSGITDTNIAQYGISGGSYGSIAGSSISTYNTASGINTNLGYAAGYGAAIVSGTSSYPASFTCGSLYAKNTANIASLTVTTGSIGTFTTGGHQTTWKSLTVENSSGTVVTIHYLGY